MRTALAALAAVPAAVTIAITGCSGGTTASRPAWCHQAEHLNQTLAEPVPVQDAILTMTAGELPPFSGSFAALHARQKADWEKNHAVLNDAAGMAVTEGTAAAVILRRECGY